MWQAHCSIGTVPVGHVQTPPWQTGGFATSVQGVKPPSAGPFVMTQLGTGMPHELVTAPPHPARIAMTRQMIPSQRMLDSRS